MGIAEITTNLFKDGIATRRTGSTYLVLRKERATLLNMRTAFYWTNAMTYMNFCEDPGFRYRFGCVVFSFLSTMWVEDECDAGISVTWAYACDDLRQRFDRDFRLFATFAKKNLRTKQQVKV